MRKKLLSIFTLLCLAVTSAWADESWTSGDCTVTLSGGVMTISGSGAMANYEYNSQPWNSYKDDITSVVIESGVTSIGNWAFAYCSNLTSVTFDGTPSLETIGNSAFYLCTNLTSIDIPASVTSIGNQAFSGCTGLTSITFASGSLLTTIGESAFNGCSNTNLTSIVIPASVTSIGNSAFESCSNLASVTVFAPKTCTLGSAAFNGCTNLQIYVPSDLVDTFKTNWSTYTDKIKAIGGNCGETATWSLNSTGVLTISGSGAMANYEYNSQPWNSYKDDITSVVIESGVTSIGNWAFAYCSNLTSVTIPASVTSIGIYAFYSCKGLTSVTIPASVTSTGQSAFAQCIGLASITFASGPHLTTIGVSAFISCTNLTSIEIPASVTSIGNNAFAACSGLTSITFASGSQLTTIGESAFNGCSNTNLTSIEIPASVTSIGNTAFKYCRYLTSVTVYSTSCTLGTQAFDGCTNLANIYVFSDLVDTYKGMTNWSAYSGKITAMTNPHGKCGASDHESDVRWVLTGTSPNYTLTIMKVGSTGAMANYGGDNQPWKDYRSNIKSVVIVNGVTTIGDGAFMACSNLATVTFDGNSQPISFNPYAFSGCGFTSVTIPSNVTSIGDFTFSGCPNLTEVNIGKGVTSIQHHAFNSCPKLTTITVDTENTKYDSRDNCNAIIEKSSNKLVVGCKGTTIPNTVTSIGDAAFWKCAGLTSIAIPASVTSIGASAFKECPDLTSVTFATGSQLTSIGVLAFYDCKSLASIEIPASVTSIGIGVFNYCENLTTITVNTENTTYDSRDNCNAIIETTPKKLVAGCKNSTIPDGVTSIGKGAFKTIGLTSVTIPVSVTSIEDEAFYNCTNLGKTYVLPTTVPTMGSDVFKYCNDENFAIIVPAAKYDDYCSASGWSSYQSKMKNGYTVTCPDVITTTGVGPLVQQGETVTLSGTGDIPTGDLFGGYSVKDADGATVNVTETEGVYTFAMPEKNVTVSVALTPITYAISYDLAGGTVATANPTTYTVESNAITLVNPTRTGYTFAGWTGTGLDAATTTVTIAQGSTGDRSYTATWTPSIVNNDEPSEIVEIVTPDGEVIKTEITIEIIDEDSKTAIIRSANIPASESGSTKIAIPAVVNGYTITSIDDNAFKGMTDVTDIYLPETDQPLALGENALKIDDEHVAMVHVPVGLLGSYALNDQLAQNFNEGKVKATVTAPNRYWTFSAGVDVLVPEGVGVYICKYESEDKVTITELDDSQLLVNGKRIIKANNGVLIACNNGSGNAYDIVANPGGQTTMAPASYDAKSYGYDNMLEPVLVSKNYPATSYYVLKNGEFHKILANSSKMPAGKAVLRLPGIENGVRTLQIIGGPNDGTTGINNRHIIEAESKWFDMQGRRIERPTKAGLYINNGKKVVIK